MRVVATLCKARTFVVSALLVLGACKLYRGELLHAAPDASVVDAGHAQGVQAMPSMQAPAESGMPAPESVCERGACFWSVSRDGCQSVGAPSLSARPTMDAAAGTAAENEIYLGLRAIHLTDGQSNSTSQMQEAEAFGLDLDATCTNAARCARDDKVSCRAQDPASQQDGPGCRDNALAQLMRELGQNAELSGSYGLSESAINCELWRGGYNMLIKITQYDGAANDPSVRVDWYASSGLETLPSWSCPERYFSRNHALWAGDARWSVDPKQLASDAAEPGRLPPSVMFAADAFVRDGVLVSRMPDDALLRFAGDGMPLRGLALRVRGAYWIGRLERAADGQWSVREGLIAGRITVDELLRSVRQLGVCEPDAGAGPYAQVAQQIRAQADILGSGESQPQRACDALSFGIGFEAAQITPGSERRALPDLIECCAPGAPVTTCQPGCGDGVRSGGERCDTAIPRGSPGACPDSCPKPGACELITLEGSACDAHCELRSITTAGAADGCCPDGAGPGDDPDCGARCGNAVIEPGETCDPPETCPVCQSDDKCLQVTTVGAASSCNVSCRIASVNECRSEDGCCPANCTHGGDNDCSSRCGDGVVDKGTTETCEARSSEPCPRSCDDGEPCTHDVQTGSSANCNVRCSHFPITTFTPNDGCCPKGATHKDDPDCK